MIFSDLNLSMDLILAVVPPMPVNFNAQAPVNRGGGGITILSDLQASQPIEMSRFGREIPREPKQKEAVF